MEARVLKCLYMEKYTLETFMQSTKSVKIPENAPDFNHLYNQQKFEFYVVDVEILFFVEASRVTLIFSISIGSVLIISKG